MDWREYQRAAAAFFDTLGMQADVEVELRGARSVHKVDVVVRSTSYGIDQLWLVECKLWRRKVHKEKVLALREEVDDVGADRGFLLSESGFDPGAVTAARLTNITLTNLEDLAANAEADRQEIRWNQIYSRTVRCWGLFQQLQTGDRNRPFKPGVDTTALGLRYANLSAVLDGLRRVRLRQFPIPYSYAMEGHQVEVAGDAAEFLRGAVDVLDEIEPWLERDVALPWLDPRSSD